jgi:hypothetical protein
MPNPISNFFDDFLPYHLRYALIPQPMQRMWGAIVQRTYPEVPAQLQRFQYQLFGYAYNAHMRPLLNGELPPRYRYRHFTVPKADGTLREIAEPGVDLKAVQYKILGLYLAKEKPHPAAIGYRRHKSAADHAWAHAGAQTIITADIEDFFPSTTRYRVRQLWKEHSQQFNDLEVTLLTNLTTYRGALPQGAPTSPVLSNLVNVGLDVRLAALAKQTGATYTRYADDLAFSWKMRPNPPADFERAVRRTLHDFGYRLHPRKGWQVWSRADEPQITGGVLKRNGTVDIAPELLQTMATLEAAGDSARLMGYRGYRQMMTQRKA